MFRLPVVALVVAGVLVWPSHVNAEVPTIDADGVPIVWVDLVGTDGLVSQPTPLEGVVDHGHGSIEVAMITVDDDGLRNLQPLPVAVSVDNLNYPAQLSGVAASENGNQTPVSSPDFAAAAARVFNSADLRDYIRSDDLDQPGVGWGADYDVTFDQPLGAGTFLLIHERNGNAEVELQALDASGRPLVGAPVAILGSGSGWNTGIAPADLTEPQPVHLTVLDVDRLLAGSGTSVLHGLRIDNNDEADINITPMGEATGPSSADAAADNPQPAGPVLPVAAEDLTFTKTVYRGTDLGAQCQVAATFAEARSTDEVTYCFTVTNTSADHLAAITITDPYVSGPIILLSAESDPLAPGHSARYFVEAFPPPDDADGVVDDTFVNTASVAAVRVDTDAGPIPDVEPVTASAEAIVFAPEEVPTPGLELATSVYAGVDGGGGCPAADLTLVDDGDPITYCYTVTNTGNTHLDAIVLDQFEIDGAPVLLRADSTPLAPGQSAYFYLDANAPSLPPEGVIMTSSATANSVDGSGADLAGVDDASGVDGTEIKALPPDPAVAAQSSDEPATESSASQTQAPEQLAFTGWETWLVVMAGIGLIAGGWALLQETAFRERTVPLRRRKQPLD